MSKRQTVFYKEIVQELKHVGERDNMLKEQVGLNP